MYGGRSSTAERQLVELDVAGSNPVDHPDSFSFPDMPIINFKSKLFRIGSWTIAKLPKSASIKLPSRGMVFVEGTINGLPFQTELEPDGKGSHWFRIDKNISESIRVEVGDTVTLSIEPVKEWPEPNLPEDLKKALGTNQHVNTIWKSLTPMAHWDWIRWIRSTKNLETRRRRIEVTFSKLRNNIRRPCCFNRTECTEQSVSDKGILLDPITI